MNTKRLLKLADFLDNLPRKKFDYGVVVRGPDTPNKELTCGSVACAMGWTPIVFPRVIEYKRLRRRFGIPSSLVVGFKGKLTPEHFSDVAMKLFGINRDQATGLFIPGWQDQVGFDDLPETATPKQVASLIRRFVKKNTRTK